MTVIRPAVPSDFPAAAQLLRGAELPLDGLAEHFGNAFVAETEDRGSVVGCVALEVYGETALLRSLAVTAERRGERLGERLAAAALASAKVLGATDVYLLTQTAEKFFPRFGFAVEDRGAAPEVLKQSAEFRGACCPSAVLMHARTR
jgi:amino-acid N-acetyltransferase